LGVLLASLLTQGIAWGQAPSSHSVQTTACAPDSDAQGVVELLIQAHEQGQVEALQRLLDERLPGHQALLDEAVRQRQTQARTKVHVLNLQAQCAPQAASITFAWERRSLLVNDLRPVLASGNTSILLANRTGQRGRHWRVVSISEPNPFWQRSGPPARTPAAPADAVEPGLPAEPASPEGRSPAPRN
jgi:hypothetical protein